MKRLRHIDERLERWSAWLESGGGSVAIATFARQARVDCARPDHDHPLRDDAMHAETGRCVVRLPADLREVVLLSYLRVGSIRGLASALHLDADAMCKRIKAIDHRTDLPGEAGAPPASAQPQSAPVTRRQQRRAERAQEQGWLSRAVGVARAVGLTREAVHAALCRADRQIARMLSERRRGSTSADQAAGYLVGSHAASAGH